MWMAVDNHVGNPPMCFLLTLNYHTILCTFFLANITNKRALCIYRGGGGVLTKPQMLAHGDHSFWWCLLGTVMQNTVQ